MDKATVLMHVYKKPMIWNVILHMYMYNSKTYLPKHFKHILCPHGSSLGFSISIHIGHSRNLLMESFTDLRSISLLKVSSCVSKKICDKIMWSSLVLDWATRSTRTCSILLTKSSVVELSSMFMLHESSFWWL